MHHALVVARAIAAGMVGLVSSVSASTAGTGSTETVPIKDRIFFERGDWAREFAPPPQPPAQAVEPAAEPTPASAKIIPLRVEVATPPSTPIGTARSGLPIERTELSWAHTPPVPHLLSKPLALVEYVAPTEHVDARPPAMKLPVLQDRKEKALEDVMARRAANPPMHVAELERKKPLTEVGRLPVTKLSRERMSTRWSDPLAVLEIDEDAVPRAPAPEFILPFAGGRVTSLFNDGRRHPAIDLAGKLGSPVLATTEDQTVLFTGWRGGYGNAVITREPSGRMHLYAPLKSITSRVGEVLAQGDKLGHLGSTGRSTGPHVHYEVRTPKGVHINPVTVLFPGRTVRKGLAWVDVDQFAPSQAATKLAVEPAASAVARVASAKPVKAAPRRQARQKRKYRNRQYVTAGYTQRSRRASWSDEE